MSLIYTQNIDGADEEHDFLSALIGTCPTNFILDGPRCDELHDIRETLIANNEALSRLIEANPRAKDSYLRDYSLELAKLEDRVLALKIPEVLRP